MITLEASLLKKLQLLNIYLIRKVLFKPVGKRFFGLVIVAAVLELFQFVDDGLVDFVWLRERECCYILIFVEALHDG